MTNAIGVTTRKNNIAKITGFTTAARTAPIFNQNRLSLDRRAGATNAKATNPTPRAKINNETAVTAPAINAFAAPIASNTVPSVHPNARSLPTGVGASSR